MPVGEIAGDLLGGIFRFIGRFFAEIILEIIIKGTGYFICRIFSKRVDPDGILVVMVGLIFIGMVGFGILAFYEFIQLQLSVDSCLDSGGRFNYTTETCEFSGSD